MLGLAINLGLAAQASRGDPDGAELMSDLEASFAQVPAPTRAIPGNILATDSAPRWAGRVERRRKSCRRRSLCVVETKGVEPSAFALRKPDTWGHCVATKLDREHQGSTRSGLMPSPARIWQCDVVP